MSSSTMSAVTERPFSWRFTTPLYFGSTLNPINSALIATALVPIAHGVGVPIGETAALVSALYVATAIAQPTAGKAADVFGPRRVFLTGLVIVLLGGLVGGFAPNLATLLVSRVMLGLGTSCAYPSAMLLIRRRAQVAGLDAPPGNVLGRLQIAGIATASLGLPIGGLLVQLFSWRAVFFINVPVAIIALIPALLWVPKDGPITNRRPRQVCSALDATGIVGFAAGMVTLLLFLSSLPDPRWLYLILSIAVWIVLVWWERRAATPFLDVRLLAANMALSRTYLRFALTQLCAYTVLYGITQWLEATRGLSELSAGLLLLPMTVISGLVVAAVSRRNLIRPTQILSATCCIVAGVATLFLGGPAWLALTVVVVVMLGVSQGCGTTSNTMALYTQAPAEQLGTASGLLRSSGYLGSIASSAVIGIVFHEHPSNAGVGSIGWIMLGTSVLLLTIVLADRTLPWRAESQS